MSYTIPSELGLFTKMSEAFSLKSNYFCEEVPTEVRVHDRR